MEKYGNIEEGRTPPEKKDQVPTEKKASRDLADHTMKRLQDAAEKPRIEKGKKPV